ncbi:MAG TPA: TlpA disulfide reductase family protein [Caulobacteraceae bacterium]|jgi:thiol-disulfide isomerase/thioredoxin
MDVVRRGVLAGLGAGMLFDPAAAFAAKVGKPAPGFTLSTFAHQKYSLAQLKGEVVVLNYWATWCTPCKAEMVVFENFYRTHPGTDLKLFAIATEDSLPNTMLTQLQAALSFPLVASLWGSVTACARAFRPAM